VAPGWRAYGVGVMALGLAGLAWGPARAVAPLVIVAGAAVEWRRTVAWAAAALAAYYLIVVVILVNGRAVLAHYAEYGTYSGLAEQVAVAAGGLVICAASARIDATLARRLTRVGQVAFGICALLFGGAHFVYMDLTAPLVPRWLPPSQEFWGYATGIGHIAAGLAIMTGVKARLAAILLTAMYASFTVLVHVPMLLADSSSRMNWTENAINLSLIGVAWVVADSFPKRENRQPVSPGSCSEVA
jgi:uncharacterized membrane protein YphA (DoxX/SURF4 family)